MRHLVLGRADLAVGAPVEVLWEIVTGIEAGREVLPDVRFDVVAGSAFAVGYEWTETFSDGRVDHVRVSDVVAGEAYTCLPVSPSGRSGRTGTRVVCLADASGRDLSTLRFEVVMALPAMVAALLAVLAWPVRLLAGDRSAARAFGPTMARIAAAAAREHR